MGVDEGGERENELERELEKELRDLLSRCNISSKKAAISNRRVKL